MNIFLLSELIISTQKLSSINSFLSFQFLKSKRYMQMLLNPVVPKDQWVCSVVQLRPHIIIAHIYLS